MASTIDAHVQPDSIAHLTIAKTQHVQISLYFPRFQIVMQESPVQNPPFVISAHVLRGNGSGLIRVINEKVNRAVNWALCEWELYANRYLVSG
jgi:hypothetical protein